MATMTLNAFSRASVERVSCQARLPEADLAKVWEKLLCAGDMMLSSKGRLGEEAMVEDLEHPTLAGHQCCVARLRPIASLTPATLVEYLRSALGQTLLDKAGQGKPVPFIPMKKDKGLPIVIPHPSELQQAEALEQESVALSREVEELSRKLQRLSRQGWMEDIPTALLAGDQGEAA